MKGVLEYPALRISLICCTLGFHHLDSNQYCAIGLVWRSGSYMFLTRRVIIAGGRGGRGTCGKNTARVGYVR